MDAALKKILQRERGTETAQEREEEIGRKRERGEGKTAFGDRCLWKWARNPGCLAREGKPSRVALGVSAAWKPRAGRCCSCSWGSQMTVPEARPLLSGSTGGLPPNNGLF